MFEKKTYGLYTTVDMKNKGTVAGYFVNLIILLIICAVCIFPILWVFMSSFKDIKEFLSVPPTIIPKSFHPEKVKEVWNTFKFGRYYANTLVMAAGVLCFNVIINGLAGYVISKMKPVGASLFFTIILWTMLLPNSTAMVPLFATFMDFPIFHINLMDSYVPMWMMAGANAFNVLLFKNFFDTIPTDFIEAAKIDGSNDFGIFIKIIMPLSLPIIMVVSITSICGAWQDFLWPYLIIRSKELDTVAVSLFKIKQSACSVDKYMIVLMFSIIPPAVIFMIFQKYIINGITLGGVKG